MNPKEVCQACNKLIEWGSDVIVVRYGKITGQHAAAVRTTRKREDFFHAKCAENVAIVQERD